LESQLLHDLATAGGVAAVVAVVLNLVWLGLMIRATPGGGNAQERLQFYAEHPRLQYVHFLPTMLIAIAHVPIWVGLAAHVWATHPSNAVLAAASGLLYVPFALIGYSLQFTVARAIAEDSHREELVSVWRVVSFGDAPESAAHWLVVLGYALWGMGAAFAAAALVARSDGLEVVTGYALGVTALLTWLGAVGVAVWKPWLKWATIASGATSVVAIGLVAGVLLR
jgi:hypothetical protein